MAAEEEQPNNNRHSFFSFPEDVQLSILSFLNPPDISSFSLTSKPSLSLSLSSSLWFSLCHRQFSPFTNISLWLSRTTRHVTYRRLYNTLSHLHPLVGFWRRSGSSFSLHQPPLVVFEWAPSFVIGYRISPSLGSGLYRVLKSPFVWIGIGPHGDLVSFLDPDARFNFPDSGEFEALENDLVSVSVNFIGDRHVVIEENWNWGNGRVVTEEGTVMVMEEIYCYFANRTSPGTKRKQRRRDKERRKLEPEHFVKIVNCEPTPQRPLQGLWKVVFFFFTFRLQFVYILLLLKYFVIML